MLSDLADHLKTALADRYALERELGRGGMGTVLLAHDLRHDRPVALKVLHPELAATVGPSRFLQEIRLTGRLQHPHILPMLDSGEAAGQLWYTMPYVEGESLRDLLRRDTQVSLEAALRIGREVAEALDYAHRRGVIHRDIKPENIMLSDGQALVADFGLARALGAGTEERLTETGIALGTPAYMSPEQATGNSQVDARSDVYALGCVMYEMLAGEPPFTGRTPQAIIAKRFLQPALSLRHLRPTIPGWVDAAVATALAQVPADRFATAAEFARALGGVPPGVGASDQATVAEQPSGRRSLVLAGTTALALYVLAALGVLGAVRLLTSTLGLPDWVLPGAVGLLLLGLPIILTTAVVQRRHAMSAPGGAPTQQLRPREPPHWLTWRRALSGGVLAFAGLGLVVAGYIALRALGLGPAGTLLAAGVLQERERLLLADFGTRQVDTSLSGVLTEVFRIDLAQSPAVTLVPSLQVAEVLGRMQRSATARFDPALAREVAVREGIKGVVTGEIARAGAQYVVSAQLISAPSGEVLTAHRETAPDSTRLIAAVDRLSRHLRAKIGESLKSIGREPPLERVTTASLAALRQYTQAVRAGDYEGDRVKAIALLQEAVGLDSSFAMAYRTLGMYAASLGQVDLTIQAYSEAFARRDRLTERERNFTLGDYHQIVTFELPKAVASYQAVLENHPHEREALNNLALVYTILRQHRQAEPLLKRAVSIDSLYMPAQHNLIMVQIELKKWREARASYERAMRQLPGVPQIWVPGVALAEVQGDYPTAETRFKALKQRFGSDPQWRANADGNLGLFAAVRGRLRDAESYLEDAMAAEATPEASLTWAIALASVVAVVGNEPVRGLQQVERALVRYPLDSLRPMDRPYLGLAYINALAARPDRASALVGEYERVVDPKYRQRSKADVDLAWGHIALAERRWQDAIVRFREAMKGGILVSFGMSELGRAYDLAGQADSAIALYERYITTADAYRSGTDATELARVHRRLGELYEGRGERDGARASYGRFVELWRECDPELRAQVTEVRRRLAELTAEPSNLQPAADGQ